MRVILILYQLILTCSSCSLLNNCNGHGRCRRDSTCECFIGWGAESDITSFRSADCSSRTCPSGLAWADVVPSRFNVTRTIKECSNVGTCDHKTGRCNCPDPYEGNACQRSKCPNSCSGHGFCTSLTRLASNSFAIPLQEDTVYEEQWDHDKIFGCVCDSSWTVGINAGETQTSEWFGPDCSLSKYQTT